MKRLLVLSVAVLLITAACGGGGDAPTTQASSTTSSSTAAPTTPTTSAVTTTAPTTSVVATTISPDLPPLLVADDAGIHGLGGAAWGPEIYVRDPVTLAVPDMLGGVVFQRHQFEIAGLVWRDDLGRNAFTWEDQGPEPIWRLAGPDHEPEVVVDHDDAMITLVDVVEIEGRPHVMYRLLIGGPGYDEAWVQVLEWLCLFDLMTGETQYLGLIGSYESSTTNVRLGGDVAAVTFDPYADPTGTAVGVVPVASLAQHAEYAWLPSLVVDQLDFGPAGTCPAAETCELWAVATAASDASRISWVESGQPGDHLTLVTVDGGGGETGRQSLGVVAATQERARFIDDDGSTIVVSGGATSDDVTVVANGAVTWLGRPGATASLWQDAATTYTERPLQELPAVLRGDGLGLADFGLSTAEALDALEVALGPYSRSISGFYTYYYWDNLSFQVAVDEYPFYRQDGIEHLVAWGIWPGPMTPLRTSGGIGLGATLDELVAAHPNAVDEPVYDDECMPKWYVWLNDPGTEVLRRILVAFDASPHEGGRIISMHAGAGEGC